MNRDRRSALSVAALATALYLPTAIFCGLYLDDYGFLRTLEGISPLGLWRTFLHYVPGRNLHIAFFYALIRLTGGSVPLMHVVSVAFDAANGVLVLVFVRRFTGLRSVAWATAAIFLVATNHGETHFWINALPQNQVSTFLVLCAFVLASRPMAPQLGAAIACYVAAIFTYEQAFFLWPLLLAAAWRADSRPRPARFAAAAAILLIANILHLAARYFSPYADGGRPLIRFGDVVRRSYDAAMSVRSGLFPWPTSSHIYWAWSIPVAAIALAVGIWLARTVRGEANAEAHAFSTFTAGGWTSAAAFGAAWTALAYGPNLFWYLSPRHSLLPSVGWALAAAAIGAAASRRPRIAVVTPYAASFLFAVAAVSDIHEGTQWIDSRHLRDAFITEARRLDPPVDSLFLIGAPRSLRRAPAFNLFHDVTFAAGRALGRPSLERGDRLAVPTRGGLVFANDLSVVSPDAFRWIPAAEANLISYDPASRSFACATALNLELPDGTRENLPLRANRACAAIPDVLLETVLIDSRRIVAVAPRAGSSRAADLTLLNAVATVSSRVIRLQFDWRVEKAPAQVLAFVPSLRDAAGAQVLDAVYPNRGAGHEPVLWPLVDDKARRMRLKPGDGLRQIFEMRRRTASGAPKALDLLVFEIDTEGYARPAGRISIPIAVRGM